MMREWILELLSLTDEDWWLHAFNRDPLVGRVKPQDRLGYCRLASECGLDLAREVRSVYGDVPKEALAERSGVKLVLERGGAITGNSLFAFYREPDTIAIDAANAEAVDALLAEGKASDLVGGVASSDLLFAHEFFHFLEKIKPEVYTARKLLTLWKFGGFQYRSRILCLSEIGAMAFAKELTGLKCSPYIFNVLMLAPVNAKKAEELLNAYLKFKANLGT